MSRASLVFVAAACVLAACFGDPVPSVGSASERNSPVANTYYITTWERFGAGVDHEQVANTALGVQALVDLDGNQTVAIVIHGREGSAHSEFANEIRTALAMADRASAVFVVDWSAIAGGDYNQARNLVPQVAQDLSNFIMLLEEAQKLDRNRLHIIGFDLGAHVAGIASRITASRARKITALSPAGEGWGLYSLQLRNTDAQTVEVIHTDAVGNRAFGIVATERVGTLDFFPNGGTAQPGCSDSDNWCHHNRSWQLFVSTVYMGGHLIGTRCDTVAQALNNLCSGLGMAVMGSNDLIKVQGIFRMNTGRTPPYAAQKDMCNF